MQQVNHNVCMKELTLANSIATMPEPVIAVERSHKKHSEQSFTIYE